MSTQATSVTGTNTAKDILALGGWLAACFLAALGGVFVSTGDWYLSLNKPSWNPPSWLFGPVWTTLYCMMAVAAWQVWRVGGWQRQRVALSLFVGQLVLNALWTPIFFGAHQMGWAFVEICMLWVALIATIGSFWKVKLSAALLLLPYLAWCTFAAVLNFTLWRLNS